MTSAATADVLGPTFRELFEREIGYVCHSLRRLGVREADVEDSAQEVFVAVHRRFDDYDPERPARPWLLSFAYRFAANYRRLARNRRERLDEDAGERTRQGDDPEQRYAISEKRRRLLTALSELPFEQRAAFVMYDMEGMTAQEVGDALDVPLNTVYSRVRLARAGLRQRLGGGR